MSMIIYKQTGSLKTEKADTLLEAIIKLLF